MIINQTKKGKGSNNGQHLFSEVIVEDDNENWADTHTNSGNITSHNSNYSNPYGPMVPSIKRSHNFDNHSSQNQSYVNNQNYY